ncbi:methionyl-tRNA formyltransferase [Aurantibacter crassamenti]|uniref:methionyl-tRNA formyltransferase n=1 Tax=Aurantibacter crassamenti TaxID=1837375 RepID=UPI00193A60B3|nr:methionyl-tRNA formyltransferase [Aurantibacter crassamenti]MBM1106843.1 methionyl-tRNA formyltransferase [Aurantibacter crassamenti]
MRKLRIVFMGTPDFAVTTLDTINKSDHEVVGVITAPDRPAGRGRKLQQSAVKQYALANDLTVLQPKNLKSESFLEELKTLNANLQIVVAFRMLPKVVWQMPEYGTFNLHASLLPNYRGAAPINWAIINGESKTGVTTFFIDDKIDTGEIILQKEISIGKNESAGELHDKLMNLGANLTLETVNLIAEDKVTTTKQVVDDEIKSAYKIFKETCQIDWHKSIDEIHNHIRGMSPYPTAHTNLTTNGETIFLKIYKASMLRESHSNEIGKVIATKKELKIAVDLGYILLEEIQLPGKKRMPVAALLNGLKLSENAKVG